MAEFGDESPAHPGQVLIYRNRGPRARGPEEQLEEVPVWATVPGAPEQPTSVLFADVNQDGWMDLVVAGRGVYVYYGSAPRTADDIPLDREHPWHSRESFTFSFGVDAGVLAGGPQLDLVASTGCNKAEPDCSGQFLFYRPHESQVSFASLPASGSGARVLLADLVDSPGLELIAGQWTGEDRGSVSLFARTTRSEPFPGRQSMEILPGSELLLPQSIAVEMLREGPDPARPPIAITFPKRGAVFTLPVRRVREISRVSIDGVELPRSRYAWIPGENWVSLRQEWTPVAPAESAPRTVKVEYRPIVDPDILVANWNPASGNYAFQFQKPIGPP